MIGVIPAQRLGCFMNGTDQFSVAGQVRNAKLRLTSLTGAEQFTRTANFHVLIGDDESVVGLAEDCQPFSGGFGERRLIQ